MKLLPVEKLALEVVGWGLLAVLSFFFHVVGFFAILALLTNKTVMFMFVHSNTTDHALRDLRKDFPYDSDSPSVKYEQLTIPGVDRTEVRS